MYWHVHSTCISDQTVSVIRYAISAYKCCHISSRHVWHGVISSNGQLIMHKRNHIYRYLWSNCKNLTHRLAWLIFQTSTMSNLSVHEYLEIQVWNYIYCVTMSICAQLATTVHDDVIKWKHFPRYWPFVRRIHRSPVNSPHKGQWRGALMFYLMCVWINDWVNNGKAGDLRRYRIHYDVTVMHVVEHVPVFGTCWKSAEKTSTSNICFAKSYPLGQHLTSLLTHLASVKE